VQVTGEDTDVSASVFIPIKRLSHLLQHAWGRSPVTNINPEEVMPARKKATAKTSTQLPTIKPHAGGIDIGATQIQVAVPLDADKKPVRTFTTFTDDLLAIRDWLKQCHVKTVAMESTSVYWIPLFQILEAAQIEVCLVNARHCKNLPGRKTDISDCQWLQYLHSVGLLRASFRPPEHICAVRSLLRHRSTLVRYASDHVRHLHKALTQMNIQIQNVISDLTGLTGLSILEAILSGERDGLKLAALKDHRIKASRDTIARSLQGDWRSEHLFVLRQALDTWKHYQHLIAQCDEQIQKDLAALESKPAAQPLPAPATSHRKPQRNEPRFEARAELHRLCAVDLTQVPGVQVNTALVLFTELGPDFVDRFPTAKCFASWLGLCPDNRITGGKIISAKTREVKSRVSEALRLAAHSLWRAKNYLGDCFRRWKARLGTAKAITAMAHKLARILWHLIKHRQPYDPTVWAAAEEKLKKKKLHHLHQTAAALGYKLISTPTT
jgi:transposase